MNNEQYKKFEKILENTFTIQKSIDFNTTTYLLILVHNYHVKKLIRIPHDQFSNEIFYEISSRKTRGNNEHNSYLLYSFVDLLSILLVSLSIYTQISAKRIKNSFKKYINIYNTVVVIICVLTQVQVRG